MYVNWIIHLFFILFYNKHVFIKLNDFFICSRSLVNSIYRVSPLFVFPSNESYHISHKKKKLNTNQTWFLHLCLGHINLSRIWRLVKYEILPFLILKDLPVCEYYIEGKMTKRFFSTKLYRAKEYLDLVHTNVSDPFNIYARGVYEYFITFIDGYYRFKDAYLM